LAGGLALGVEPALLCPVGQDVAHGRTRRTANGRGSGWTRFCASAPSRSLSSAATNIGDHILSRDWWVYHSVPSREALAR
jgi:hypothetical protein